MTTFARLSSALLMISFSGLAHAASLAPLEPKKLTVGPSDNLDPMVTDDARALYYTQTESMASRVRRLDLTTGLTTDLVGLDADSKSPRVSPDGRLVAFTYFRDNALGDICYTPVETFELTCLADSDGAEQDPFWLDNHTLGYISTDLAGQHTKLWRHDILSRQRQLIVETPAFNPSISIDRTRLVFRDAKGAIVLFDLSSKKILRQFRVNLPGLTAMTRFSAEGKHLYLTQYMFDTNRDLRVDGRDRGTIFRADLSRSGDTILPEQVTSTDSDCSFPFATATKLYLTCAYGASLDIYAFEPHGVIPADWTRADLVEAHLRARAYAERLLYLNRLATLPRGISTEEFLDRALLNLFLMREWAAVDGFARLRANDPTARAASFVARALARSEALPSGQVTAEFRRFLDTLSSEARAALSAKSSEFSLTNAWLLYAARDSSAARAQLSRLSPDIDSPLALELHTSLWLSLTPKPADRLLPLESLVQNATLPVQSRVYYLSLWLEAVAALNKPLVQLERLSAKLASDRSLQAIVDNESDLYAVIAANDTRDIIKLGQGITKRVIELKPHYYPQRLLFARAMTLYSRHDKPRQLTDMASLWLSHVPRDSKEKPHVLEMFRLNTLDTAYEFFAANKIDFAKGAFFNNIRMTDDLESHFQYARLHLEDEAWKQLEERYALMITDKLIRPSSLEYARFIRALYRANAAPSLSEINQGITLCDSLPDDQDGASVKYLTLGYLYQKRLDLTREGISFTQSDADLAHRQYTFALDLSTRNSRVQAAVLQNLALLHHSIRNYSLASEYFARRAPLPFDQPADLSSFRWLYARSLYKANRFKEALHQIESELNSSPRPEAPWRERAAFYAMNAENFPRALEHYTTYFASSPAAIKSGVILSHAFSLHKAGRANEALLRYKDALSRAEAEGSSTEQASASLEYHPLKTRFIAYGLMAQLPLPQSQRAAFLAQRMTLYASLRAAPSRFQFTSSDLIAQELKDHQRHAILLNDAKRLAGTLTLAQSAADAIGYLSQPVQQSFKNALYSAALTPPYAISPETLAAADALMSGMKDEVAANHRPSSAFLTMYDEARVLHAALHARARSPKNPMPEFERRVEGLARTPYLEAMKSKL